jgi:hypothetical protein
MRYLLDLLQALGLGSATGMRPFLPALVAGVLARADLGVDFEGTSFAFLEAPGFLAALAVGLVAAVLVTRRAATEGPAESALAGIGIGLGALLGAASLDDHSDVWWPGLLAGGLAAVLAGLAIRQLLARTRARLDAEARGALPVYVEGAALLLAVLVVFAEPVALLAIGLFAWLLVAGRRRQGQKYAGLRILR